MMHPAPLAVPFASLGLPSSAPATVAAVQGEAPAALVALGKELFPYLGAVPDPRGRQGRRYELAVLLVLCLVGFCTGCQSYLSVARWGRALKPEVLRAFGFAQGRTPCAATWLN